MPAVLGMGPGLYSREEVSHRTLHLPCLLPDTGDHQKSEAKLFAPRVFWVAVCLSVGSGRRYAVLGSDCAFLLYFSTCTYFEKLLWKYSNISKNRRVCDPQLSSLALGVITFEFFFYTCSPTCSLSLSLFWKYEMFCGVLLKKIFFNVCVCVLNLCPLEK